VRISWLTLSRKSLFARLAVSGRLLGLVGLLFRGQPRGDVAETEDARVGAVLQLQRRGVALEHAAVHELDQREVLGLGRAQQRIELAQVLVRVLQLLADERQQFPGGGLRQVRRDVPHAQELAVAQQDLAPGAHDQDAVGGGVEGGAQEGDGPVPVGGGVGGGTGKLGGAHPGRQLQRSYGAVPFPCRAAS
jgi:hypothetical protein